MKKFQKGFAITGLTILYALSALAYTAAVTDTVRDNITAEQAAKVQSL